MALARFDERLGDVVQATIAYADLFDFPLEPEEVWRDLIGVAAGRELTQATIHALAASGELALDGPYVVLPRRVGLAEIRKVRRDHAARLWPVARRLGALIGLLPFVRMVAATGSLAANNPDATADLDYLIVTVPGRLWLVRAMAVALVRLARPARIRVCPNYLLTTRVLTLDHQDLFTAHELLQAVPIVGRAVYREMLDQNRWSGRWLPNRYRQAMAAPVEPAARSAVQRAGEALLAGRVGGRLEAWEARRKRQRLGSVGGTARFTADTCEGHYGQHRRQILDALDARCAQLGIASPFEPRAADREEVADKETQSVPSPAVPAPSRPYLGAEA